jgi:lipopolysaccharide/colanic/teichoic acid biosynthesis glycosyltransferase
MSGPSRPRQLPLRRFLDVVAALVGLVLLSPVLVTLALWILLRDGRPILFTQMRVGRAGKLFRIWKFRTMRTGAAGGSITAAGDRRITPTGALLRRFKLDELPQLFNVLRGDMSLIGPRPEMPEYVNLESLMWQAVLQVPPGITDLATLLYRDEEALLSGHRDVDRFYREALLPAKLRLNLAYLQQRCLSRDARLIWLTVRYSLAPGQYDPARIHKNLGTEAEHVRDLYSVSSAVNR